MEKKRSISVKVLGWLFIALSIFFILLLFLSVEPPLACLNFDRDMEDYIAGEVYGVHLAKGVLNQAYEFNGRDSYIYLGDVLDNEIKNSFTITVWIKLAEGALQKPHNYIFWKADDSPGLRVSGDRLIYAVYHHGEGCGMISRSQIKEGRWYHIAFTFDGQNFNGYINGFKEAMMPNTIGYSPGGSVFIGRDEKSLSFGRYFKGKIDELKIWDYALSGKDIIREYGCRSLLCIVSAVILIFIALLLLFYLIRPK